MSWFIHKRACGLFFVLFFLFLHLVLISAAGAITRIMPLGDSITRGFSGSTDNTGYRRSLYLSLTEAGYDVDFVGSLVEGIPNDFDKAHEGHSGFRDDHVADMVYDWLTNNPADIALLHIGTNAVDESAVDVEEILNEIDRFENDNAVNTKVILARIINRNCITANPSCPESVTTMNFNNNVAAMVQDRINMLGDDIVIVDMENGSTIDYPIDYHLSTDDPPGDMWDDKHPFDTGYEKMADVWFNALNDLLPQPANFTADSVIGPAPLTVNFADESLGPISSWEWDFGDDSQLSYEQNPTHTYEDPGIYTVSLAVTRPLGSDTETKTDFIITVKYFDDVPPGYWAEEFIHKIYEAGITGGCSQDPLQYCPEDEVTRAQMAVFLLSSKYGSDYTPPPATGIFDDVPAGSSFADWIEQLYNEGITGGCSQDPLLYCPENPVTRAQMAVFLLSSKYDSDYTPPPATGIFGDVPVDYWAAAYIEQLYNDGITGGCSQNPLLYCPDSSVTRAQMAVFIVKTFEL